MIVALVGASALALPAAAHAAAVYPPAGSCAVTPATVTPGGILSLSCDAGTFSANETVTITITGENGSGAAIGFAKFAISTGSGTAMSTDTGALPATTITLPRDAQGSYNIAAVSQTSAGSTAAVTATDDAGTGIGGSLPTTGFDSASMLGLWVGGGVLMLTGGALAVGAMARRNRKTALSA